MPEHVQAFLIKLKASGLKVEETADGVRAVGPARPNAVDIETAPYPWISNRYAGAVYGINEQSAGHKHNHRDNSLKTGSCMLPNSGEWEPT